jgi:hypothetical protein
VDIKQRARILSNQWNLIRGDDFVSILNWAEDVLDLFDDMLVVNRDNDPAVKGGVRYEAGAPAPYKGVRHG